MFEVSFWKVLPSHVSLIKKKKKDGKKKKKKEKKNKHIYPDFSGLLPSNINGKIFKQ